MKTEIECPHCDGNYFNYSERRTTERIRLYLEDGELKMHDGGNPKIPVVIAECRHCGGEYDAHDLKEYALEIADSC